jgi:PAS domain S-box-containing protein
LANFTWIADQIINQKIEFFLREIEVKGTWYAQTIFAVEGYQRVRIYGMDITRNKLVEEKLHMVNRQLTDIIEFLPDATFVVDRNKKIIAWNRALEEMTGTKKEDMIGKGDYAYGVAFYGRQRPVVIDLINKTDKEIEEKYNYVKRKNNTLVAEVYIPHLFQGKGAFVWIKVSPLFDEKGVVIGAIESVRDITEYKQAEAILKKDKESFEKLVGERTDQLLAMQKELAESKHLSEIGQLAATIAHELRNPLAAIRTAAYNISQKSDNRALNSHLANIEKKVLESDQIINNLLSYARIKKPHYENVSVYEILEECINAVRERFLKWKVSVRKKCDCKKDDYIAADPLQIRELFNNILNNAYESFSEKKGNLSIAAHYVSRMDFTVSFEDNGVGITPEDIKKISEPFFTTKSKGTGLGLTICHQLIKLHNGSMVIKSEKNKGTTVIVTLPVIQK